MFANLTQPKCSNRHTNIRVQRTGSKEDDYSRREDEKAEDVTVSESFYLNMSNCEPERGDFSVITKITLTKSTSKRNISFPSKVQESTLLALIIRWPSFMKSSYALRAYVACSSA